MSTKTVVSLNGIEHPVDEEGQQWLKDAGAQWVQKECLKEDETIEAARCADGVIFSNAPMNAKVLNAIKDKCRFAIRLGIGMDNIDAVAATQCGIIVANVRDAFTEEVANTGLALLLALARKIHTFDRLMRQADWQDAETRKQWNGTPVGPLPLHDETIGIVGFGRIGQSFASKVLALKMKVLVYDPFVDADFAQKQGCSLVDLATLLKESDYVSVNCPLTEETANLIGAAELATMKKSAHLVNVARGGIVNESALIAALKEGRLAGAGLDVFEQEPIANDNPLRSMDNVILTPHCGSNSKPAYKLLRDTTVKQAVQILNCQWPVNLYNPEIKSKLAIENIWQNNS